MRNQDGTPIEPEGEESDFKFDNMEFVEVDGVLGQIAKTLFSPDEPDAYLVQFPNGNRWFYEDMIQKTRKH